ncbi:hypothetical protein GEMRC1_004439 [Eukaryota sp. GEM-RC1]
MSNGDLLIPHSISLCSLDFLFFFFVVLYFIFRDTSTPLSSFRSSSHITVSGLSSGAFMSTQFHVAFSKHIKGMGSFSGGPYMCANDDATTAQTCCMSDPECIAVPDLVTVTQSTSSIDHPSNMNNSRVFIYSPFNDSVVKQQVSIKLSTYYKHFVPSSNIKSVFNHYGEHAIPTIDYGSDCFYNGAPYINNCNYDGAREVLEWLIGDLPADPGVFNKTNLHFFSQHNHLRYGFSLGSLSLGSYGMVYVPQQCLEHGTCSLHVAFHGCGQGLGAIGEVFAHHSGYAQWAEQGESLSFSLKLMPPLYPLIHGVVGTFGDILGLIMLLDMEGKCQ